MTQVRFLESVCWKERISCCELPLTSTHKEETHCYIHKAISCISSILFLDCNSRLLHSPEVEDQGAPSLTSLFPDCLLPVCPSHAFIALLQKCFPCQSWEHSAVSWARDTEWTCRHELTDLFHYLWVTFSVFFNFCLKLIPLVPKWRKFFYKQGSFFLEVKDFMYS